MWISGFSIDIGLFDGEFEFGHVGRAAFEFVENGLRDEYLSGQFEQRQGVCLFEVYQRASIGNDQSTYREYSSLQSPLHVFLDCLTGGLNLRNEFGTELLDSLLTRDFVVEISADDHVSIQRLDTWLDSLLDNR